MDVKTNSLVNSGRSGSSMRLELVERWRYEL